MRGKKVLVPLSLLPLGISSTAYAQSVSIGVSPPLLRIKANPQAEVTAPIAVINNSDKKLILDVTLKAFQGSPKNNGTVSFYPSQEVPKDQADFLHTVSIEEDESPVKSITLYPKESKKLALTFTAPRSTHDYYFSVVFSNHVSTEKVDDTVSRISSGVATNVLVSIGEAQDSQGIITEFKAPGVTFNGPTPLNLTVINTGDSYTTVSGNILIYDIFGNKAGQIPLRTTTILANETRRMSPELPQPGTDGIQWDEKFLLGVYTARAVVSFDKTNSETTTTHFIGIPLILLLGVSIILIVILGVLGKALKKLNFQEP